MIKTTSSFTQSNKKTQSKRNNYDYISENEVSYIYILYNITVVHAIILLSHEVTIFDDTQELLDEASQLTKTACVAENTLIVLKSPKFV